MQLDVDTDPNCSLATVTPTNQFWCIDFNIVVVPILAIILVIIFKGQVKNNEATQKYCIQGIYSAVIRKNDAEMYLRYMIFGPFCNTFASLFLE